MKFSELSDKAKKHAREAYLEGGIGYDWWDYTYEDAVRMGALLGISIHNRGYRTVDGAMLQQPDIYFSGFSSQGDGACFAGVYRFEPDAAKKIKSETNDEGLLKFATDLTTLQIKQRVLGRPLISADIKNGLSNYCHSHTMDIEVSFDDEGYDDDGDVIAPQDDKPLADILRAFADWIYAQLEAESDYLHSDDYVDERLADDDFDEDGEII